MRPTERFTNLADNYARYRPGYPPGAIELLRSRCGLGAATSVADLGSGTGILTELLLKCGAQVFAVEPNDAMRAAAQAALAGYPRFTSLSASAESTTLATESVDLLVAGQAFHWFDVPRARPEALRVLRSGGWAALLWNERPRQPSAFFVEYDALLNAHAADYARITASRADVAAMRAFLGATMELESFPNRQILDFAGLKGRLLSSSYAPQQGHPQHEPMMASLEALFARHQQRGQVELPYSTLVYFAQLKPPAR